MSVDAQTACRMCGTCCRTSSPTLYAEDLELVEAGRIRRSDLTCLRAGEMVHSARLGLTCPLDQDLVKLREIPGEGCIHLDGDRCAVHPHHPLQCRHLECWTDRNAGDLEDRPRLSRRSLFASDETASRLLDELDVKIPAPKLAELFEAVKAADRSNEQEAIALVDLDYRLRGAIEKRYGYDIKEQELMFGRPAVVVMRAHGLQITIGDDGEPVLSPCDL
jgi:Fe-S-cluster containining protein